MSLDGGLGTTHLILCKLLKWSLPARSTHQRNLIMNLKSLWTLLSTIEISPTTIIIAHIIWPPKVPWREIAIIVTTDHLFSTLLFESLLLYLLCLLSLRSEIKTNIKWGRRILFYLSHIAVIKHTWNEWV
jgi:hypothetical protein